MEERWKYGQCIASLLQIITFYSETQVRNSKKSMEEHNQANI